MTNTYNESVQKIRDSMPARIAKLPISDSGFPVPWFVPWLNRSLALGEHETNSHDKHAIPEFRCMSPKKLGAAINQKLCWVCGERLGKFLCFVTGPISLVSKVTVEPPSHRECAEWSTKACPFLVHPNMKRNEKDMPDIAVQQEGALLRNPRVTLIWPVLNYRYFREGHHFMFRLPQLQHSRLPPIQFVREGRAATREEVVQSIEEVMDKIVDHARVRGVPNPEWFVKQAWDAAQALLPTN